MIAFSDNTSVEAAKVGILAGSFVAVVLAVIILKTVGHLKQSSACLRSANRTDSSRGELAITEGSHKRDACATRAARLNRTVSAWPLRASNFWGDAPGSPRRIRPVVDCDEIAPLALTRYKNPLRARALTLSSGFQTGWAQQARRPMFRCWRNILGSQGGHDSPPRRFENFRIFF